MKPITFVAGAAALSLSLGVGSAHAVQFVVTNLVSDTLPARTTDPSLVNPWGVAHSPTSPFWVSNAGTGVATIYDGQGTKAPLTVTIPVQSGGTPPSAPTGTVFNSSAAAFAIGGAKPLFLFDTEQGVIAGWAPSFGTTASIALDNSPQGAIYKGLAIGAPAAGDRLYAADFHGGDVEVYDSAFAPQGTFTDPNVEAGFAPFNVQVLNGELFVAFAKQDAAREDEVAGAGLGYVDVFNLDGTFNRRIASQGDEIDAPWGLAIAPSSFGELAGSLLVGNFGDGTISAFDPLNGDFLGKLRGTDGQPLEIEGLWSLLPGNGAMGGDVDKIYFSAGIEDESHGLFGSLTAVPEPNEWVLMLAGFGLMGAVLRRRVRARI